MSVKDAVMEGRKRKAENEAAALLKCSEEVYSPGMFRPSQCSRRGAVTRDGKRFCRQHDPEVVAARRAKADAQWNAEAARKQRAFDLEKAKESFVKASLEGTFCAQGWTLDMRTAMAELLKRREVCKLSGDADVL